MPWCIWYNADERWCKTTVRPNPAAHRQEEAAAELRVRREAEAREREVARRLAQGQQREMQARLEKREAEWA